jgi:hypothetical protein
LPHALTRTQIKPPWMANASSNPDKPSKDSLATLPLAQSRPTMHPSAQSTLMAPNVHFEAQTRNRSMQPTVTRSNYNHEQPLIQNVLKPLQISQQKSQRMTHTIWFVHEKQPKVDCSSKQLDPLQMIEFLPQAQLQERGPINY